MKTIAEQLKHDFKKGALHLYDSNGNKIYYENSYGYWYKQEYNSNDNVIYWEDSNGFWSKYEYDTNGKEIYWETSNGTIQDNRPKPSCNGKVVEIDGKTYKLVEFNQNKDE